MKTKMLAKLIFIAGVLIFLVVQSPVSSQINANLVLSDEDRASIIKSTLERKLDGHVITKLPDVIVLSTKNLKPELVPKIEGLQLDLMNPREILKKSRNEGVRYLQFNAFKVEGAKVTVILSDNYFRRQYLTSRGVRYEYRKEAGEWKGELISRYRADS